MRKNTALESIQFQKSDLFNEITLCVSNMRDYGKVYQKDFYDGKECKDLSAVINKHTGLRIEFADSDNGPSITMPSLGQDIFKDFPTLKAYKDYYGDFYDIHSDIKTALRILDMDVIEGTVDLKNSKVGGVFSRLTSTLQLPREYLADTTFTNEELSAIILHELGHAFTSFEYLDRTVTTNQALGVMLRTMDKSASIQDKKVIFSRVKDKLKLDDEVYKNILNSSDKDYVTLVVLNQQIQECRSELGESVYDVTSCEYLADQFAARHGAGRYLVTSLDKVYSRDKDYFSSSSYSDAAILGGLVTATIIVFGGPVVGSLLGVTLGVLAALAVASPDAIEDSRLDVAHPHGAAHGRLSRIKHQMIQRLKDNKIGKKEKEFIINYLEEIEPIIKKYVGDDKVKLRNRIAFFFSKKHKYDFEFKNLQKDLEEMGNSNLFIMSEKIKSLQS